MKDGATELQAVTNEVSDSERIVAASSINKAASWDKKLASSAILAYDAALLVDLLVTLWV
jgi:hypothetical protein